MTDLSGLGSALGGLGQGAAQTVSGLGQAVGGAGQAALGAVEHVVQPGETVGSIAADHGVSVDAVMAANPQVLHPDIVEAGAHLSVPSSSSALAPPEASTPSGQAAVPGAVAAPTNAAAALQGAPTHADASPAGQTGFGAGTPSVTVARADAPPSTGALLQADARPPPQAAAGARLQDAEAVLGAGLLAALPREGVDWRLQQQGQLALVAPSSAGLQAVAPAAMDPGTAVLLQALASDPDVAAAFARLVGDGKAAVLAVLTARLAMTSTAGLSTPAFAAGIDGASEAVLAPTPQGVDLAGRSGVRAEGRRLAAVAGREGAPESAQAVWIRRCAPVATAVKARWGLPAGFTIAHGALASDWGRLAPGNDFFGLLPGRAPGGARAMVALAGPPAVAFDGLDEAADAFGGRLRADARYAAAFRAPHAVAFTARLASAGLTGDPLYAPAMEAVIEAHALARFD